MNWLDSSTYDVRAFASNSSRRISAIDALRGCAALAVLLFHARILLWIGMRAAYAHYGLTINPDAWLGYLSAPLSLGSLGVTLFFVLSGYCIHRAGAKKLAKDPNGMLPLKSYFVRRLWRIYPVYVAALLVTGIVDHYLALHNGPQPSPDDSLSTLAASLLGLQGITAPRFGSNVVFWTLAMELHFYCVYPLLFWLSKRYGAVRPLLVVLLVGVCYLAADNFIGIRNRLPFASDRGPLFFPYWFTWTLGFYIAEIEAGRAPRPRKRALLAATLFGLLAGLPLALVKQWELAELPWALVFGALVYCSIQPRGQGYWDRATGRLLARIGVFSYSLYAVHWPVLLLLQGLMGGNDARPVTILVAYAGCAVAVAAGWVLFHLVERWTLTPPTGWLEVTGLPSPGSAATVTMAATPTATAALLPIAVSALPGRSGTGATAPDESILSQQ